MRNYLLCLAISCFVMISLHAQSPKRELRAAWVATFSNIDWPNRTHTPARQRDSLITILNHHQATGINTIYFQVRNQCDALYPSTIEPWSADLTGVQGTAPSPLWDPLQFLIDECRKRNMKIHAWLNPYRAMSNYTTTTFNALHPSHVVKAHPEWILPAVVGATNPRILDPGIPAVREYVTSVVMDIVRRYDVDGIHFDDYFYPNGTYNDDATFAADPRGFSVRADWRRDNVNLLIEKISDSINTEEPWTEFGVSPSGIWRNGTGVGGSATTGFEHYVTIFCDSRKWIQEGWVDYLCPQVYWYITQPAADYAVLIPWWNNNAFNRHIYIGMAGYKVGDGSVSSNGLFITDRTMIPRELRMNRDALYPNIKGQSLYNTTSVKRNWLNFRDSIQQFFYTKPALHPLMPWKDNSAPSPASILTAVNGGPSAARLNWVAPASTTNEFDKVRQFVIYRSENPVIDLNNSANMIAMVHSDSTGYTDAGINASTTYYYTVTALDRFHNESTASNVASINLTLPLNLIEFAVSRFTKTQLQLNWTTSHEVNTSHFEIERKIDGVFTRIQNVPAANSNGTHHYTINDAIAAWNKPIQYRIKMVDVDGSARYSPVRTITIKEDAVWVKVFPTVIKRGQSLQVQLLQTVSPAMPYIVYDAAGREVAGGMLNTTAANSQTSISFNKTLAAGWYVIQFFHEGDVQRVRILAE
jgi:uncharacterized lipoprotein YddW (UPF0748 family)